MSDDQRWVRMKRVLHYGWWCFCILASAAVIFLLMCCCTSRLIPF